MEIDRRDILLASGAAASASLLAAVDTVRSQSVAGALNHRSTDSEVSRSSVEVEWTTSEPAVGHAGMSDGLYLYVVPDGQLVARDAGEGSELWRHEADGASSTGVDASDGLAVYTAGNTTYGVDASTGERLWTKQDRSISASTPTVTSSSVFVGRASSVYELGSISGGERWSYETGGPVRAKPAFDGEHTYVGSDDGKLYRFDDEGIRDWQHDLGGDVRAAPVVYGDVVHVANTRGDYHGVDVATGDEEWSRRLNTRVDRDPALGAGHLYLPTDEGVLLGFDSETGVRQWSFEADGSPAYSPWVAGDVVYFVGGSTLYALDTEEGEELWSVDVSGGGPTLAADSALYTGGSSGSTWLGAPGSNESQGADLSVTEATVDGSSVEVGGSVDVVATVENAGGETGTLELVVYVDGDERGSSDVEVPAGGSEEQTFSVSFDEAGSFDVRVNEVEAGAVEVSEPEESEGEQSSPPGVEIPLPGFEAGVAMVSLAAAYLYEGLGGEDDTEERR